LISEVNGEFKDFDVDVSMSGDDFKTATVNAVIKTASVNTGAEGRDKDLRSNSFFSADSFPNMTFKSDRIEQTGKDEYKIYGMLTIRSTTRPIVLNAVDKGKQDAFGTTKMGVKATTTINRFDYDVKWNKTMEAGGLIVSNSVDITLRMELNKQKMDEGAKK
jgi:polyisoprenoid-binding protein YceI